MIEWFKDIIVAGWLRTIGWAAGVSLAVLVIGALSAGSSNRAAAPAVAIALGFAAAVAQTSGIPALEPTQRWQWSLWITLGSLMLLFLEELKGGQATMRIVLQGGLVAAVVWLILAPLPVAQAWLPRMRKLTLWGALIGGVLYLAVAEVRGRAGPPWRVLVPFALTTIAATAIFIEQSERAGRITAGLGAALATSCVVELVQRDVPLGRTVVTTATLAFGSLLVYLWATSNVAPRRTLLLAIAWTTAFVPVPRKSPWVELAFAAGLAAIPAAAAWIDKP